VQPADEAAQTGAENDRQAFLALQGPLRLERKKKKGNAPLALQGPLRYKKVIRSDHLFPKGTSMSVLLISKRIGQIIRFHEPGWAHALSLALENGWSPMGVTACEPIDCFEGIEDFHLPAALWVPTPDGQPFVESVAELEESLAKIQAPVRAASNGASYFDGEEGWVTAKDAAALGKAVAKALPDVPRHDAMQGKTVTSSLVPGQRLFTFDTPITAAEWFSGRKRQVLKDLIALCRLGGFAIQRR
jgi:hypothetical protein